MKNIFAVVLMGAMLVGCDNPQRTRATELVTGNGVTQSGSNGLVDTTPGSTTGTTTGTTTIDPNFPSCTLTYAYTSPALGQIAICQSTVDETLFKFKSSLTSDKRVCLIPTYKDASGASTWIGQPQCTLTNAGNTYSGKLLKTRAGYTGYSINGVMMMKEDLLNAYFNCIDSYITFINGNCPLNPTNPQCVTDATTYRNNICTAFKNTNSGNYLDIRVR
jgi:hypothetical protein